MAQLLVGIVVFAVVFILKIIFGAAGGALKAVESVSRDNDFSRYTGAYGNNGGNRNHTLIGNRSGASIIKEYRELYEDGEITYAEFEKKKNDILNSSQI